MTYKAQKREESQNTNGVFIPTSDLMLRSREKSVGSKWAAKQEVPGKDVALGTPLQQEGPFPGEETRLWRRAWYMRPVTNFLDQGSFTLATGGGEKSPERTYKIRTVSLFMGQLTLTK